MAGPDFEALPKPPPRLPALWRIVRRKPSRLVGLVIILGFAFMAVAGPLFYPANLPINPSDIYAPPSWQHLLGTDYEGTDVLALLVTGSRYVLLSAAMAGVFTVLFGALVGLVSGYFLGTVDNVLMRITDFVLTVPGFPLLIVLSTVWDFGSPLSMGLVLGLTGWGGLARSVRSQVLSLRERGFVESARALGFSPTHVVVREVFPNVAPYVTMNLLVSITSSIYAEVGLFFLGVVPFAANNWGVMLNEAINAGGALYNANATFYLISPMVCILLLTMGIVLFLDAVDEMFNPRLREE
jgi:peptide/nickel transport system permease protein